MILKHGKSWLGSKLLALALSLILSVFNVLMVFPPAAVAGLNEWTHSGIANHTVTTIVHSPNYATDNTIFAGTTDGLYGSTDRGQNWTRTGLEYISGTIVSSIAVSPNYANDHTLFAVCFGQVYKSSDSGANWEMVSNNIYNVITVAISPTYVSDQTVYTAGGGNFYKSIDGGINWSSVNSFTDTFGNIATTVAFSPNYANDGIIFVTSYFGDDWLGNNGLYKSIDRGESWSRIDAGLNLITSIDLSPGYNRGDNTIFIGTRYNGLYESIDDGLSWEKVLDASCLGTESVALSPNYQIDQTLYVGCEGDSGVYKSTNGGTSWSNFRDSQFTGQTREVSIALSPTYSQDGTALAGTSNGVYSYADSNELDPIAASASPPGGAYGSAQSVTLSTSRPANIYFTTNGTEPDISSTQYGGNPITISSTTTLKFIAVDSLGSQSQIYAEGYTIDTGNQDNCPTWSTDEPMPTARFGADSAVVNGRIWVIGGSNNLIRPPQGALSTVEVFDSSAPAGTRWQQKQPLNVDNDGLPETPPVEASRFSAGDATRGNIIYLAGGAARTSPSPPGFTTTNTILAYNTETGMCENVGTLGTARYKTGADIYNGKMYIVGGRGSAGVLDTIEEYDISTRQTTTVATLSQPRELAAVVTVGDKIYIVGGSGSDGNPTKTCWVFDPNTRLIDETKPDMNTARSGKQIDVIDGKIYVGGGITSSTNTPPPYAYIPDIQVYDPNTNSWQTLPCPPSPTPPPTPRWGVATEVINNVGYVIGGTDNINVLNVNETVTFGATAPPPPACSGWSTKASLQTARSRAASAVVGGKIYVLGGSTNQGITASVEMYDPVNNTWQYRAPLAEPRFAAGFATYSDRYIISVGGSDGSTGTTNKMLVYDTMGDTSWVGPSTMTSRLRASATILNDKLYVVGGSYQSTVYDTIEEYDLIAPNPPRTFTMPGPRQSANVVTVGSKIYIMGGMNSGNSTTDTFWEFDPNASSDNFTIKDRLPVSLGGRAISHTNGKVYIAGGIISGFPPSSWTSDVLEYDPATESWATISQIPTSRYAAGLAAVDNTLYVIGGDSGTQHLDVNEALCLGVTPPPPPPIVTPPAAPTGLSYAPGDSSLTFSWNPSSGATGYRGYAGTSPEDLSINSVDVGNVTTQLVEGQTYGFPNGLELYFAASAYNSAGESSLSPYIKGMFLKTPTIYGPTTSDGTNVVLHGTADPSSVYWDPALMPISLNDVKIEIYDAYSNKIAETFADWNGNWSVSTSLSLGLWHFRAQAVKSGYRSTYSDQITVDVSIPPLTTPTLNGPATSNGTGIRLFGTADPNVNIEIIDELGLAVGAATSNPSGDWNSTIGLAWGSRSLVARAVKDGRASPYSVPIVIEVSPNVPVVGTSTATVNGSIYTPNPETGVADVNVYYGRPIGNISVQVLNNPQSVVVNFLGNLYTLTDPDGDGSYTNSQPITTRVIGGRETHPLTITITDANGVSYTQLLMEVTLIDPSGYVYDYWTGEKIPGAHVTLYKLVDPSAPRFEEVDENAESANMEPDINPLVTDADGHYAWDVVAGTYKVLVEKEGYHPTWSREVTIVLEPVTDLHVAIKPIDTTPPAVFVSAPANGSVVCDNTPQLIFDSGDGVNVVVEVDGIVVAKNSGDSLDQLADGVHAVVVKSTDYSGNTGLATSTFTVDTVAPNVTITSPEAFSVNPAGNITFKFATQDSTSGVKSRTASLSNGNSVSTITNDETKPLGAGVYTLTVSVQDYAGNISTAERFFVVYDPSAGFVTGSGRIIPVTDIAAPGYGETATFGFVSKYLPKATKPSGNLGFQYNHMNTNLVSTSMQWLTVSSNSAIFQGIGTINGQGAYTYRVDATDGDKTAGKPDNFKIVIWEGTNTEAEPLYRYAGDLAGGSIVIHKK